jgi:hypothetical protein
MKSVDYAIWCAHSNAVDQAYRQLFHYNHIPDSLMDQIEELAEELKGRGVAVQSNRRVDAYMETWR